MATHAPAADVAKWQRGTRLWIDHAIAGEDDLQWMEPAEVLVLWNVRLPDGLLARLPNLRGLSVRGGSRQDLSIVRGCERLLCLDVNQVRGLHDLDEVPRLRSLEFLSLFGQPRVERVPSLAPLEALEHVQLGSMKGLQSLDGLMAAPRLRTLEFSRAVSVGPDDVDALAEHPTLEAFDWFWEDVPQRVAKPVMARLEHLGRPPAVSPLDWVAQRLRRTP